MCKKLMESENQALRRKIGDAHSDIQRSAFALMEIASGVEMLFPDLARNLNIIAQDIEISRREIQGNEALIVNNDLKDAQRFTGEIFKALLNNA